MTTTYLLAVAADGTSRRVANSYDGIKDGLDDATFDFVAANPHVGLYVDDEGMLNGSSLNVPASIFVGRALFGPVVLCAPQTDDEGNTLPAEPRVVAAFETLCAMWRGVIETAAQNGQVVLVGAADPSTIPPPTVISLTDEQMERWLTTGEVPQP